MDRAGILMHSSQHKISGRSLSKTLGKCCLFHMPRALKTGGKMLGNSWASLRLRNDSIGARNCEILLLPLNFDLDQRPG